MICVCLTHRLYLNSNYIKTLVRTRRDIHIHKIMTLPYFTRGVVVKGFGRGSKELGIPTANFPESVVNNLPAAIPTGVYFGWANINHGPIYKMVMSIGWNPYYKNEKKSMETHIIHHFDNDFYGSILSVCIVDYLRPEQDFSSISELVTAIKNDIQEAENKLELPKYSEYRTHPYFFDNTSS